MLNQAESASSYFVSEKGCLSSSEVHPPSSSGARQQQSSTAFHFSGCNAYKGTQKVLHVHSWMTSIHTHYCLPALAYRQCNTDRQSDINVPSYRNSPLSHVEQQALLSLCWGMSSVEAAKLMVQVFFFFIHRDFEAHTTTCASSTGTLKAMPQLLLLALEEGRGEDLPTRMPRCRWRPL